MHTHNPEDGRLKQENLKFGVSLGQNLFEFFKIFNIKISFVSKQLFREIKWMTSQVFC